MSQTYKDADGMEGTIKSAEGSESSSSDENESEIENEEASNSSGELARVCLERCEYSFCKKCFNEENCVEAVEINLFVAQ